MRLGLSMLLMCLLSSPCARGEAHDTTILSRGVQIPATIMLPQECCPIVIFAHGHGGNRYERQGFPTIAEALARQGIGSIRVDFAGCGDSTEPFTDNCLTTMKEDVRSAIRVAKEELSASAIGLFGYSMGGRVVLELLAEGEEVQAVSMLAPAAETTALIKTIFHDFDAMHETAKQEGFYPFTQTEHLSPAWFEDMLRYDDPAAAAAKVYHGPSQVIWAQDDAAVLPHVCAHTAEVLSAQAVDASGRNHSYGFGAEDDTLRRHIAESAAGFFAAHLTDRD